MEEKSYIQMLLQKNKIVISSEREKLFDEFVEENKFLVDQIRDYQKILVENWKIKNRIYDINEQQIVIPNGKEGEFYETKIDLVKWKLTDLSFAEFETMPETGLSFNRETATIKGTPVMPGDFEFKFLYRLNNESEYNPPHEKKVKILINPDPKTLWVEKQSDKNDPFWKEDDDMAYGHLGEKQIVVASKRGRSHQKDGLFRDDDFAFAHIKKNGWSIVAVADGAGGYSLSRKGSQVACNTIIEYFQKTDDLNLNAEFEILIQKYAKSQNISELSKMEILKQAENLSQTILYKATRAIYKSIAEIAVDAQKKYPGFFNNPKAKSVLDYFHTTLIFALFKKYDFGYLIMTFGVGDCPIAVMNEDMTDIKLLNFLDVGDFAGGTRFITQYEIFNSLEQPMRKRFNFYITKDFSYLFLMTDGIYDPKFEIEANLEKHEKWLEFLADLHGENENNINIFEPSAVDIYPANQLLNWLDFWDKGNHDDRTLAIVF